MAASLGSPATVTVQFGMAVLYLATCACFLAMLGAIAYHRKKIVHAENGWVQLRAMTAFVGSLVIASAVRGSAQFFPFVGDSACTSTSAELIMSGVAGGTGTLVLITLHQVVDLFRVVSVPGEDGVRVCMLIATLFTVSLTLLGALAFRDNAISREESIKAHVCGGAGVLLNLMLDAWILGTLWDKLRREVYWRYPTALLCSVVASFVIGLLSRGVVEIMDLAMYDYDAALCDTTGFSAFVEAALYSIPDVCFVYLPCVLLLLGDVWPALSIAGRVKEVPAMGGAVVVVEDARIPRQPVPVPAPVNAPPREPVSVASLFGGYPSSLRLRVPLACAFGFAGIGLLLACYVGAFHNRPAWMKSSVHVPWVFGTARAAAALCTLCLVILLLSVHRIPLNTAYASFLGFGLVQLPADVQELPWLLRKLHSCVKDVHRKMGKVVAGLACVHIISHNWLAYDKLPKAPAVYASPRALNGGHGVAGITGWLMVLCLIVIIVSGTQRWRSWHAFHRPTVLAFLLLYSFHGTGWEFDVFPYNGVVMGSVAWLTIASAVVFRYVFSPSTIRAVKVAVAGNIVLFRATVDETVPVAAAWAVAVGEEQSHTHDFSGVTDFDPCDPHAIEFHLSVTTKRSLVRQLPCTGTKCPCATCPSGTPCAERRCGRCHRHLRAKVPPAPAHIPPLPGVHAELPCKCPCACHELEVCPEVLANCRLKFKDVGDIPDLSAFTLRGPILGPISTALRELVGNHESKVKAVYLVAMGVGITPMLSFILRLLATLARLAADAPEVERLKKLKIRVLWVSQVPDHVEHVLTLFHQVLPRFALHPDIRIVIVAKRPSRAGPEFHRNFGLEFVSGAG